MKTSHILCLALLAPVVINAQGPATATAPATKPVTITVADPGGRPVEGALVEASLPGPGSARGLTGADGRITLDLSPTATLYLYVSKDGYYTTGGEYFSGGYHKGAGGNLVPRLLADSIRVELKDVRDPVALVHRRFRGRAPAGPDPAGFDLLAGDWVAPHGYGSTTDILFRFHDILVEDHGFQGSMTITFPQPLDGIQPFIAARPHSIEFGSNLAPPHRAPVDGYLPTLTYTVAHRAGEPFRGYAVPMRNYLFRTRTETDAAGVIRRACYGWILGEIEFDPRDPAGPQLSFAWYFNPDPDPEARSLEDSRPIQRGR